MTRYKYLATCLGGGICGLGGLYFTMVSAGGNWSSGAMDGKGWLAVALVIFALWKPLRAVWGSVLFGALMIMYMRVTQLGIPTEIYKILPYVVTVIVLISISIRQKRENQPPASLGNAYFRENWGFLQRPEVIHKRTQQQAFLSLRRFRGQQRIERPGKMDAAKMAQPNLLRVRTGPGFCRPKRGTISLQDQLTQSFVV